MGQTDGLTNTTFYAIYTEGIVFSNTMSHLLLSQYRGNNIADFNHIWDKCYSQYQKLNHRSDF